MAEERPPEWTDAYSVAGGRSPWSIVAVISIATFMVVLDTSIVNVALDHIAGNLATSYEQATWVLTSFLVSNAIVIPLSGWLSDAIGRKRYYMLSVALFTGASVVCGMSSSLGMLIAARVVQGIGGGGLAPVEQSMLADTFPPEKRGGAFAAYGVVVIIGPILGPTLGGWITDTMSWNWIFLINLPVGVLSLVLVWTFVHETEAFRQRRERRLAGGLKIDYVGIALVALLLGSLEMMLDRGQTEDWFASPWIVGFAVIAAASLAIAIPWELTRKAPVVDLRLFANRNFSIANLLMFATGAIVFSSTQFIPQLLQQLMGYSSEEAGLALTFGGLAALIVMPLTGVLTNRINPRYLIGFGLLVQAAALWHMSTLNTQMTFSDAAWARLYQSIGLPLIFIPITTVAYVGLRPEDSDQASGLLNVARNLGGTVGISLVQTMLAQRGQVNLSTLVDNLNPLNPAYRNAVAELTSRLAADGLPQAQAKASAVARLYREAVKAANMISYINVFQLLAVLVFISVPLVLLMRKPRHQQAARGH
jgi:DHA2 family multidrug resistance protein